MSSIRGLATLFTRVADLQDALEKDNAKLEEKNAKLEEKNAKLEEKNAKLEEKNAKLKEKYAKLEEKNSTAVAKLEEKYAKLGEKYAKLEEKMGKPERAPSQYNLFMKRELSAFKQKNDGVEHQVAFKEVVAMWTAQKDELKRKRSPSPPPADGSELGGVVYEAVGGDASRRANCCSICGKCDGHNRSTCPSVIRSFKAY
jgi:DNA repair exonuclease SbcCD ATPase subunit